MSNIFDDVEAIVKREMVLFFLIDQSGSMAGKKIGAVNTAIREVLPEIRGIGGSDAEIKVAALQFSSGCKWMYQSPIPVDDFQWVPIEAYGVTDMGEAFKELAAKMSKNAFLKSPSASVAPAIFLMSDGQPTDDYASGLELLKNNRWFKHSIKVAVAIGDDADCSILEEFTGNSEAVIRTHTPEALKKMIHFVTITSSKISSQSQVVLEGDTIQTKQDALVQDIQDFLLHNEDIDQNADDEWD